MSTVTPKTPYDPDDSTIENSLQLLEKKLRWWSPILLGGAKTLMPFTYKGAVGLSTVLGYILFLAPAFITATLITDAVIGVAFFTTIITIGSGVLSLPTLLTAEPIVTIFVFSVLYTGLTLAYEPVIPNASAVSSPYEWEKLIHSAYICTPVTIGSFAYGVLLNTPSAFILTGVASWWLLRRLTFTVIWDETRYIVSPPYTETLLATRVPFGIGVLCVLLNVSPALGFALLTTPFIATPAYLHWRASQGSNTTQDLGTIRMHERSGISTDIVEDFGGANAYKANANDELLRGAVQKFNSFIETELDTTERLHLPDGRLTKSSIRENLSQAERLHDQFRSVAYRPERFDELLEKVQTHSNQYIEVIESENQ